MVNQFSLRLKPLFFCLFCCVFSTVGYADDIEIYLEALEATGTGNTDSTKNPNVLFVMDTSGSMDDEIDDGEDRKIDIMKTALSTVIEDFADINIGLARFNGYGVEPEHEGGTVIDAVSDVNVEDNRDDFIEKLDELPASGGTPLSEVLYEMYLYMSGGNKKWGLDVDGNQTDATAINDDQYISPIVDKCQVNSIVLLSDGEASVDQSAIDLIENLTGVDDCVGNCMDEMAGYMADNDMSTSVPGKNPVYTYTIGFGLDIALLKDTADKGAPPGAALGAGYFNANNLTELENAFRAIAEQIQSVESATFVAPAVTVNSFSRTQSRDEIYYVLFKPSKTTRWNGNLKKYRVGKDESSGSDDIEILDATGVNAINDDTGYFKEDAKSIWSSSNDGHVVEDGGMAYQLDENRKLYGNLDASSDVVTLLTKTDNDESTEEFLDLTVDQGIDIGATPDSDAAQLEVNQERVAAWTLGRDVDDEFGNGSTDPNYFVGDSLHGSPYVLSYGTSSEFPEDMIFFTSNQGMLHAVSGDTGKENWAYVPDPSLFRNFGEYFNNKVGKVYGLDSALSFSVNRDSTNAVDKAHLFFGQRRGGNKVFAVDVTNADQSTDEVNKLWTISGDDSDFDRMGQTWAKPVVANVELCNGSICEIKEVLFISGGYDQAYDDETAEHSDLAGTVKGNAIYMVDTGWDVENDSYDPSNGGKLLWMASSQPISSMRDLELVDMTHSIPSPPTVVDIDGDGLSDYLFALDVAGQVFRIDFRTALTDTSDISASNNASEVSGGMIADLTQNNANRRFYNPLDATILPAQQTISGLVPARIALATGSGYRAHPLEDEPFKNRMYVIFDRNILYPQFDTSGIPSYLYATSNAGVPRRIKMRNAATRLIKVNKANPLDAANKHKNGFFVKISEEQEKFLSPTFISNGRVFATSYLPEDPDAIDTSSESSCTPQPKVGKSSVYIVDLNSGFNTSFALKKPGLAAQPVPLYIVVKDPAGGSVLEPVVVIGTEILGSPPKKKCKSADCPPCVPSETNLCLESPEIGKAGKQAWWEEDRMN